MEEEQQLDNMSCICHACYRQATRNVGTNNFNPRWRDKLTSKKGYCGVAGYNEDTYRRTQMASPTSLQSIYLGSILSLVLSRTLHCARVITPTCKMHYMPRSHACSSCNSKPKCTPDIALNQTWLTRILPPYVLKHQHSLHQVPSVVTVTSFSAM